MTLLSRMAQRFSYAVGLLTLLLALSACSVLGPSTSTTSVSLPPKVAALHAELVGLIGVPYKNGGDRPEDGFDCSGLVRYAVERSWGVRLPRSSRQISEVTQVIDSSELRPGDLVFYNTLNQAFSHVGVFIGEGRFIHAPTSGGQVRVESMRLPYWVNRFNGARRIMD
jgi:cell wall-associated NlpC family hydrolase